MKYNMLVVSAHIGDFVWRSGGSIAKYIMNGHNVKVIVLSLGIRGESNHYWKQPGANFEEAHALRQQEGLAAAKELGVTDIEIWDYADYPMEMNTERLERLAHSFREFRPDFIVTHDKLDAFNTDHNLVSSAVVTAYAAASGAGFQDGLPVSPRNVPIFGFEPHVTEICQFVPGIYVDISDAFEAKRRAMMVFSSQPAMMAHYTRKAETRANEASLRGGRKNCRYAEAFATFGPVAAYGDFVW